MQAAAAAGAAGLAVWVAAPWVAMARRGTLVEQGVAGWTDVEPPSPTARVLPFRRFSLRRRPSADGLDTPAA